MTGREVSVGSADLTSLIAALAKAPDEATNAARAVVAKGALNVKNDLNQQAADSPHFKGVAGTVTYDVTVHRHSITAEIGPDMHKRGGTLGHIFFLGGANGGGGTGDIDAPLREEEPKMVKFLVDAMGRLL
mgnify:FL=1